MRAAQAIPRLDESIARCGDRWSSEGEQDRDVLSRQRLMDSGLGPPLSELAAPSIGKSPWNRAATAVPDSGVNPGDDRDSPERLVMKSDDYTQ